MARNTRGTRNAAPARGRRREAIAAEDAPVAEEVTEVRAGKRQRQGTTTSDPTQTPARAPIKIELRDDEQPSTALRDAPSESERPAAPARTSQSNPDELSFRMQWLLVEDSKVLFAEPLCDVRPAEVEQKFQDFTRWYTRSYLSVHDRWHHDTHLEWSISYMGCPADAEPVGFLKLPSAAFPREKAVPQLQKWHNDSHQDLRLTLKLVITSKGDAQLPQSSLQLYRDSGIHYCPGYRDPNGPTFAPERMAKVIARQWACSDELCSNFGDVCWFCGPDVAENHVPVPAAVVSRWASDILECRETLEDPGFKIVDEICAMEEEREAWTDSNGDVQTTWVMPAPIQAYLAGTPQDQPLPRPQAVNPWSGSRLYPETSVSIGAFCAWLGPQYPWYQNHVDILHVRDRLRAEGYDLVQAWKISKEEWSDWWKFKRGLYDSFHSGFEKYRALGYFLW